MMQSTDIPAKLPHDIKEPWVERGGSAIIAADGRYVVEPVYDREQLIIADLDLSMIDRECMSLDVSGHYARPDVFSFSHRTIK
jgi:predicted amidohydrolase